MTTPSQPSADPEAQEPRAGELAQARRDAVLEALRPVLMQQGRMSVAGTELLSALDRLFKVHEELLRLLYAPDQNDRVKGYTLTALMDLERLFVDMGMGEPQGGWRPGLYGQNPRRP